MMTTTFFTPKNPFFPKPTQSYLRKNITFRKSCLPLAEIAYWSDYSLLRRKSTTILTSNVIKNIGQYIIITSTITTTTENIITTITTHTMSLLMSAKKVPRGASIFLREINSPCVFLRVIFLA